MTWCPYFYSMGSAQMSIRNRDFPPTGLSNISPSVAVIQQEERENKISEGKTRFNIKKKSVSNRHFVWEEASCLMSQRIRKKSQYLKQPQRNHIWIRRLRWRPRISVNNSDDLIIRKKGISKSDGVQQEWHGKRVRSAELGNTSERFL